MKEDRDGVFSLPVLIAIAGSAILFAGTFLDIGRISAFGWSTTFNLHDLSLDQQVMIVRIISLISVALLVIPKMPKVLYSVCGAAFFVLFVPKAIKALDQYRQVNNIMQASGLSQFVDVKDYFRFEAGYYLLVAGALILLGASVYYLVRFFINRD
jgi:hypothetical protein